MKKPRGGKALAVPDVALASREKKDAEGVDTITILTTHIKKRTTPRRQAQQKKKVAIATSVPLVPRKVKIVENISKKSKPRENHPKTSDTLSVPKAFTVLKSNMSVAMLSPFKVHINHGQLASSLARYAGAALVFVGGVCTVWGMDRITSYASVPQKAETISSCIPGTYCPPTTGGATANLNVTPEPDVNIQGGGSTLTGSVNVSVTVPMATRVDLFQLNATNGQFELIGTMIKQSDLVWSIAWQTTRFSDGDYTLKTTITNQYGTYTHQDTQTYRILNHPIDDVPPTTTSTNDSDTGSTSTEADPSTEENGTDEYTPITVNIDGKEPLSRSVLVFTDVKNASGVRHTIRPKNGSAYTLLGSAYYAGDDTWKYAFDTKRFNDGFYDIRTQAVFSDGIDVVYTERDVEIKNTLDPDMSSSTVTVLDEPIPAEQTDTPLTLAPSITLRFPQNGDLHGTADLFVEVQGASFVELYLVPERSITPRFLGLAMKDTSSVWKYAFKTENVPNGVYDVYANVRHRYGDSVSTPIEVTVRNETQITVDDETQARLTELKTVGIEVGIAPSTSKPLRETLEEEEDTSTTTDDEESGESQPDLNDTEVAAITEYTVVLKEIMDAYSVALRSKDTDKAKNLIAELERKQDDIFTSIPTDSLSESSESRTKEVMHTLMFEHKEYVERGERIIRERVGDSVSRDTDQDGITDYDELNLYMTNPTSADTDQDGFIDGLEVVNGYNPTDATRETNIQYESPREGGIVRDDLLSIAHITNLNTDPNLELPARVVIAGKALPSSYVTLYIFSTPTIITVKADANGAWSYIFDKELDDGTHEMYIGMTDNAGKIVAKSKPFPFVKTAEAFTPIDAENALPVTVIEEPTLLSSGVALVIGSLAVVALGLVLILLGLHAVPKRNEPVPA